MAWKYVGMCVAPEPQQPQRQPYESVVRLGRVRYVSVLMRCAEVIALLEVLEWGSSIFHAGQSAIAFVHAISHKLSAHPLMHFVAQMSFWE